MQQSSATARNGTKPINARSFGFRLCRITAIACFWAVLPFAAPAQTGEPGKLPPAVQDAVRKGLSAAKQQQWSTAIRYFEQARTAAPASPVPLFNLGLVEAQVVGRELRAICWFNAYLAMSPDAQNAAAVRLQVSQLEKRAQDNVDKFVDILKALAARMPSSEYWALREAFPAIAGLLAKNGNIDAADRIVQGQADKELKSHANEQIAEALAKTRRIPAAIKRIESITDSTDKTFAYGPLFTAQLAAGLFSDAKTSALHSYAVNDNLLELAKTEYLAGRQDDALALLANVRASVSQNSDFDLRQAGLVSLAVAVYKIGRTKEAEAALQKIKKDAYGFTGKDKHSHLLYSLMSLVNAENTIGHRSVAKQLAKEGDAARIAGEKAKEKPVGLFSFESEIWNAVLFGMADFDRAKELLPLYYAHDAKDRRFHEKQLAEFKISSAAAKAAAVCESVKSASAKTLAEAASPPPRRAQAWGDYIKTCLDAPLFTTDLRVTLADLAGFSPEADALEKSREVFNHVKDPAEQLIDRINDIHELRPM